MCLAIAAIGLVEVLMTSASTRVFAQPSLPSQIQTEENKVNNVLQADENKIAKVESGPPGLGAASGTPRLDSHTGLDLGMIGFGFVSDGSR